MCFKYYYICSIKTTNVVMIKFTKTEEQIMRFLWNLENGYMKDLVDIFPAPKPAYTTIATMLTRMTNKGYVGFEQHGKVRLYFPKIKKTDYIKSHFDQIIEFFFNNSITQFFSFFTTKEDLSIEELEEFKRIIQKKIDIKNS